jgi:hypothetical protein
LLAVAGGHHDAHAIAEAMWRGIRAHPAAVPLVLTRRTLSATGFTAADALIAAAAGIRSVAGTTYPNIEALSVVAMQTTVEEDFDRGLRMLLDGVATRRPRKRR